MTILLRSILLIGVLGAAAPALAADQEVQPYANIGLNYVSAPQSLDFTTIVLRGGARYGKYFGGEIEGAIGIGAKTVNVGGFDIKTNYSYSLAAYAVGAYPVKENIEVFGRLGYVNLRLSADAGFGSVSESDGGFAGGFGAQYLFGDGKNGVRFDYTRFELGGDGGINNVAVSYVRRF